MIAARRTCRPRLPSGPPPFLQRGDLVQQGDRYGVVARVAGARVQVWPVRYHEVGAAADVPVTGLADRLLLRARGPVVIHAILLDLALERQTRAGAASADLLKRIERAAAHVAETERVIRRWAADREHRRTRCQPSTMVW